MPWPFFGVFCNIGFGCVRMFPLFFSLIFGFRAHDGWGLDVGWGRNPCVGWWRWRRGGDDDEPMRFDSVPSVEIVVLSDLGVDLPDYPGSEVLCLVIGVVALGGEKELPPQRTLDHYLQHTKSRVAAMNVCLVPRMR